MVAAWPGPLPTGAKPAASSFSKRSPLSSPPAASAKPGASLPTPGSTRATAWPLLMKPAPSLWTWSSSSSIPPEWSGRPASRAFLSPKPSAAKAASYAIKWANASWKDTTLSAWTSPRVTSSPAPSTPKSKKAAGPNTAALISTSLTSPLEVGPTCHYMMGGIRVDAETAQSTVPGLFAAGEAAAGLHGSNRLGGNSLSDLLVFGRRAGLAAAEHAKRVAAPSLDNAQIEQAEKELLAPFSNTGAESPYAVHRDLQEVMQNLVGIYRTQEDLKKALLELEKLKARAAKASVEGSRLFNPGWHLSYDLKSMLIVSEAVTLSALARTESRGAHSRIDYPNADPVWEKKNNIIVREGGEMKRRESPVPEMPPDLKQILAEDKA